MRFLKWHASDKLAAYLDNQLSAPDRVRVEAHLAACDGCRKELTHIRVSDAAIHRLPLVSAPDGLWSAIEAAADSHPRPPHPVPGVRLTWQYTAAVFLAAMLASGYWILSRPSRPAWEVTALNGAPLAGERPLQGLGSLYTGESIETDSASRARIRVASIGSVVVEPGTLIRLVATGASEHRLALRSGAISAVISAPPRIFIVDTPAATAVDLGCEYQLQCDRDGAGALRVRSGWVALEWKGRESLVPGGASCRIYPGRGPGTPTFDDASPDFIAAVNAFDQSGQRGALNLILDRARTRDTLTLWHMLSRVNAADRIGVYERLVALAPPPASVSRHQVLALDADTLTRWREELAWIW